MTFFLFPFISGASFLLSFLLYFHPLQQNIKANRWLSFFVFTIGCAFIVNTNISYLFLSKCLINLQFLLGPSLYISILYFVKPNKVFKYIEWLHFLPFFIFGVIENIWNYGKETISTYSLFLITENVSFFVRDILPFLTLFYIIKSYIVLVKHKVNLKLVSSDINQINLTWLIHFLFILLLTVFIWINNTIFELPYLIEVTPFVYSTSIFFLAYYSIKQKTIFAFKEKDLKEISEIFEIDTNKTEAGISTNGNEEVDEFDAKLSVLEIREPPKVKPLAKRLSKEQIINLSLQLSLLMENEKIFLDNDLNLPTVAEKLGISIHEASFLINETTKDNFYNFINKYRIEEAKRLLTSSKIDEFNILGIAFASGFNSKTAFNTTFKKLVGISPSQYSKEQKSSS